MSVCWLQKKKQKSQSVPEKINTTCHHCHVCTVQKHTPFSVSSPIWQNAAVPSSLRVPPWNGTWRLGACQEPAHLVFWRSVFRGWWTARLLFDRINLESKIQIKHIDTELPRKHAFRRTNCTIFFIHSI